MVVVGYGVAALLVIVLLIVFNVRAGRNREREPDAAEEPTADVSASPAVDDDEVADVNPVKTDSADQIYRNSMRQMKSGQPGKQPASAVKKKTPDSEYREAMRNLRNPPDK
jgi:hypothetical protein